MKDFWLDVYKRQANRYAETETVKNAVDATQLHKIVVVYKGMDMPCLLYTSFIN